MTDKHMIPIPDHMQDQQLSLERSAQALAQMALTMQSMADMIMTATQKISDLEREVRLLTKVTPAQVKMINAAVRDRARALCRDYQLPEGKGAKLLTTAIRGDIKSAHGTAVRDIPRCEYQVVLERIALWEDYDRIMQIKRKAGKSSGSQADERR